MRNPYIAEEISELERAASALSATDFRELVYVSPDMVLLTDGYDDDLMGVTTLETLRAMGGNA